MQLGPWGLGFAGAALRVCSRVGSIEDSLMVDASELFSVMVVPVPPARGLTSRDLSGTSAELSPSLKVSDRGRNTKTPVRNRLESVRACLWAPPRACLAWVSSGLGAEPKLSAAERYREAYRKV